MKLKDILVEGQGTLDKCFRTEYDQPNPVTCKIFDQVFQFIFYPLDSAWAYIGGIHGLGKIYRYVDILSFFFDFFHGSAYGWPGQSDQKQNEIGKPKQEFKKKPVLLDNKFFVDQIKTVQVYQIQ
jgi:hypothetical protein